MMKLFLYPLIIVMILLALTGCSLGAAPTVGDKTFLETLEFDCDEYGTITARGNIKVGAPVPFFSSEIYLDYEKTKDAPNCTDQ